MRIILTLSKLFVPVILFNSTAVSEIKKKIFEWEGPKSSSWNEIITAALELLEIFTINEDHIL